MGTGHRYKVATVAGIPFYVGRSWLFIAALYVWIQYARLMQSRTQPSELEAVVLAVLGATLFFGSVVVHEGAHAVMARLLDIPVAGITLVFWGGATEAKAASRGPLAEFLVSFVGPASTLGVAGLLWVVSGLLDGLLGAIVRDLAWLNLLFAGLNALPGFPLDGGRMLLATAWGVSKSRRTGLRVAGWGGLAVGAVLAVAAVMSFMNQTGWWFILGYVAFIMIATGRGMEQRIALRDQLGTGTVADAMREPPPEVPATMPLADALERYLREADGESFPVVDAGRVIGTVSLRSARKVGAHDPFRPVRDGLAPLAETVTLEPGEPLDDAVEWLGGRDGLVLEGGRLVGALSPDDVERWYRRRYEGHVPQDLDLADEPPPADNAIPIPPRPDA
jgi:Zn-dependent protease